MPMARSPRATPSRSRSTRLWPTRSATRSPAPTRPPTKGSDPMTQHDTLDAMLAAVIERRGTDMLLTCGSAPLIRVDGALQPAPELAELDDGAMDLVLCGLLDASQRA